MDMIYYYVFILHLISTFFMVGVIWVVQIVHYPSFYFIDKQKYQVFQEFHMHKISMIVVPMMVLEIFSGLILIFNFYHNNGHTTFYLSVFMLICIWTITGSIFTKLHNELLKGYDKSIIKKIIEWNWSRTLLWTLRLFLISYILYLN